MQHYEISYDELKPFIVELASYMEDHNKEKGWSRVASIKQKTKLNCISWVQNSRGTLGSKITESLSCNYTSMNVGAQSNAVVATDARMGLDMVVWFTTKYSLRS